MKHNGFEYVDLGLSVNWATMNVGATTPFEFGLYFPWGKTIGFTENDIINKTIHASEEDIHLREYNGDAAQKYMGGNWRVPTKLEFNELEENTFQRPLVVKRYGCIMEVGVEFVSIDDENKKIIIPYNGFMSDGCLVDGELSLWSSNGNGRYGASLFGTFNDIEISLSYYRERCMGVRGVLPKK